MKPMTKEELVAEWNWNLTNHKPTAEGIEKIEKVRAAAKAFAEVMIENCPTSRDLSLALTSMEEATFHANAAIARNETDDKKEA